MVTPARDAAYAEHEQGTGSLRAGTQDPQRPTAVEVGAVIAQLQQRVQVWIDSDKILAADGSALLAALDQARAGLAGGDSDAPGTAARAEIEWFVGQVQALVAARLLEASDGHLPLAAAARMIAGLPSAGATNGETDRRRAEAARAQIRPAAEISRAGSGDELPSSRSERNSER
jgi:hypothetical protein